MREFVEDHVIQPGFRSVVKNEQPVFEGLGHAAGSFSNLNDIGFFKLIVIGVKKERSATLHLKIIFVPHLFPRAFQVMRHAGNKFFGFLIKINIEVFGLNVDPIEFVDADIVVDSPKEGSEGKKKKNKKEEPASVSRKSHNSSSLPGDLYRKQGILYSDSSVQPV